MARTPKELDALIRMHADKEMILIDTAGRGRKNAAHMRELKELSSVNQGIRFNLVLSAETRDEGLYESVRAFGCVPIDSLIFTKLDETGVYGQILNAMAFAKRPAAYLTTGQRVPEDIEHATRERLTNFFIPN
ncbi:MAG: hypothetical protein HZB21_03195 [Deltaproteobacteria bacterium]|nr:hypothetical protein [Deltaproteobacteria bacterium]